MRSEELDGGLERAFLSRSHTRVALCWVVSDRSGSVLERTAYHIPAHGEAVRAPFPVRAHVPGCKPAPSEYRVSLLLRFLRKHEVGLAAVNEQRRLCLREVPLRNRLVNQS